MPSAKNDVIARLRADILIRHGLQKSPGSSFVENLDHYMEN